MARSWTPSQEDAMCLVGKTLLISAAAGSGKTSVLTERIIRRLLDPEHPADLSRMLIVTFTRAAAAELRSRIGSALSAAMEAHPDDPRLPRQMLLLGSAEISTIDAFFQKVVKTHFEQLQLPASFRMADPAELLPLSNEILNAVIDDSYRKARTSGAASPLEAIRDNGFARQLDHLMSNRSDGKLNEVLLSFYEQFQSYRDGISLLQHAAKQLRDAQGKDFSLSPIGRSLCDSLFEDYTYYLSTLRGFALEILSDPEQKQICGAMLDSDMDYCRRVLDALKTHRWEQIDLAVRSFLAGRFSGAKNKSTATQQYQSWRTAVFREELKERIPMLERASLSLLAEQTEATAALFEALWELYSEYERRLLAEKTERGILGFDDVRRALARLLTAEDGAPTALADTLSDAYDEVYVDEYQDVDELQDRIFALIGRDHRFMVGDIKQSIYGFRGSEPKIFSDYRRRMPLFDRKGNLQSPEYCIFMSENFRCNAPIIHFANQVCAFLFAACADSIDYRPEDDLAFSKPQLENPPPVHPVVLRSFEPRPRGAATTDEEDEIGEEIHYLIREIRRLLDEERLDSGARIEPEDIAVLVRTRKASLRISRALSDTGIPARSDTPSNPLEDPLTMDTVNLLRAIDNPYRDLPLSEALLSPLCGFSLEELDEIRGSAPEEKALYDALVAYSEAPGQEELGARVQAWIQRLERWQEEASVLSADRFLRRFFREECIAPYTQEPALLHLYDRARTYQNTAFCGLFGFLDLFVKQASSNQASMDGLKKESSAVNVMTIHHSKGLEFPVVFVACCGARRSAEEKKASVLYHRRVGGAAKLYDPIRGEVQRNLLQEECARVIREDEAAEAIRVLYVALTRARERLYVTGTIGKNADSAIRYVHPSRPRSVLNAGCDMYRILAALTNAPLREGLCIDRLHYPYGTYDPASVKASAPLLREEPDVPAPAPDPTSLRYQRVLSDAEHFVYPLAYLQGIPTKVAASRLHAGRQAEKNEEQATEELLSMMSAPPLPFDSLLLDRKTPSAAEVGSATHAFLEFCDFSALKNRSIDAELERLLQQGFLSETAAAILRRDHLERFCHSELYAMLLRAKRVQREQKFATTLPLSVLSDDPDAARDREHSLFVQGSIDLVIEDEQGRLILVDYKSDAISSQERGDRDLLIRRFSEQHGEQLACYAIAIQELYGRLPDAVCIYSLALGELLEIRPHRLTGTVLHEEKP